VNISKSWKFLTLLVLIIVMSLIVGCEAGTAVKNLVEDVSGSDSDIEAQVAAAVAATQTAEAQNQPNEIPTQAPPVAPPDDEPATPESGGGEEPTPVPPPQPLPDPNPELLLPFWDDFDDGLDPVWRVINGRPLVVEGRLTSANEELSLELGNTALKNYTIEFDLGGEDPTECGGIGRTTFGLSPVLHYRYAKGRYWSYGNSAWYSFEGNEWEKISESEDLDCGHFEIIVSGSQYQIFINGQLTEDLIFVPAEGPLLVRLEEDAYMDNFSITP